MIDAAILFVVQWIVVIVLARQLQAVGMTTLTPCGPAEEMRFCEGPNSALWALVMLFLIASTIGYHAFFEGVYGATPGKRAMGLRVISLTGAEPPGLTVGALRAVVRQSFWLSLFFVFDASPLGLSLPPVLFFLLPLVAFGLVASAAVVVDGRGVHDQVAGTTVVRNDQIPPAPKRATEQPRGAASDSDNTPATHSEESV